MTTSTIVVVCILGFCGVSGIVIGFLVYGYLKAQEKKEWKETE